MTSNFESAVRVNGIEGVTVFLANCMIFFSVIRDTDNYVLANAGEDRKPLFLSKVT